MIRAREKGKPKAEPKAPSPSGKKLNEEELNEEDSGLKEVLATPVKVKDLLVLAEHYQNFMLEAYGINIADEESNPTYQELQTKKTSFLLTPQAWAQSVYILKHWETGNKSKNLDKKEF